MGETDQLRIVVLVASLMASSAWISPHALARTPLTTEQAAAKVDGFLASHWAANQIASTSPADDAEFLRRITLDLVGRIPTVDELDAFLKDTSDNKREALAERLIAGPEFPLHMGSLLDEFIQTRYSGNEDFVDYLRRSVRDRKPWDTMFREMMVGPWKEGATQAALRFLDQRAKTSDVLAVDTARVFFGVDISCAKCHDHPLVDDWTQEHFYGMVAFFNRTTGGKGKIGEKKDGEVTFLGADGKEKVAKVMFLSGAVAPEANLVDDDKNKTPVSRREQLVRIALEEKKFFSRAIVNRLWRHFFGRGLVNPVDQMHSGNEAAVPGLLEWLAEDFAERGYDLHRLTTTIVSTNAYQLSSLWAGDPDGLKPEWFAAASLRPLSKRQLANSLMLATGKVKLLEPTKIDSRVESYSGAKGLVRIKGYLEMETHAAEIAKFLDAATADFQSSVDEALFLSNNPGAQAVFAASEGSLASRLSEIGDHRQRVAEAIRHTLSRPPKEDELERFAKWLDRQDDDAKQASERLVWALLTSAEFRFNH